MPFLRLSRDRRGYESTFLLHAAFPGARPRVLYWYRTAPSVRVGRPALDEDAIRTIEEQHPEVEFNWSEILAVGAAISIEVEPEAPPRRRSKPSRGPAPDAPVHVKARETAVPPDTSVEPPTAEDLPSLARISSASFGEAGEPSHAETSPASFGEAELPPPRAHDLLEGLVGREIATRLHARYAELHARISELATDEASRNAWRARAEPLNPDLWVTPGEILSGVQRADSLFDQVRKDLLAHG